MATSTRSGFHKDSQSNWNEHIDTTKTEAVRVTRDVMYSKNLKYPPSDVHVRMHRGIFSSSSVNANPFDAVVMNI